MIRVCIGLILVIVFLWLFAPLIFNTIIFSPTALTGSIGTHGPIEVQFPVQMDPRGVESRFTTNPGYPGRFKWIKNNLYFFPDIPFEPGINLQFELAGEIKTLNGFEFGVNRQWQVKVRENKLIYLSKPNSAAELYISSKDGLEKAQLTATGGAVLSYTISLGGEQIIYSAKNKDGGADLWLLSLADRVAKLMLSCGVDRCTDPEWATHEPLLVYHRWRAKSLQPLTHNPPQLWIYEIESGRTEELLPAESLIVRQASWSPSGDLLAVSDERNQGIRLLDFSSKREFFIQAREGLIGDWTLDGKYLVYSRDGSAELTPDSIISKIRIEDKEILLVVDEENHQIEYGVPALTPDGKWIAVGVRLPGRGSAKQVWLYDHTGRVVQEVTSDPVHTYANLHWDSQGKFIVAQRFQLGGARNVPQVIVWNRAENSFTVITVDGAMPKWVP